MKLGVLFEFSVPRASRGLCPRHSARPTRRPLHRRQIPHLRTRLGPPSRNGNLTALAVFREVGSDSAKPRRVEIDRSEGHLLRWMSTPTSAELANWRLGPLGGTDPEWVVLDSDLTIRFDSQAATDQPRNPPILLHIDNSSAMNIRHRAPAVSSTTPAPPDPWRSSTQRTPSSASGHRDIANEARKQYALPNEHHARIAETK
jgi:hypothetical protein